MVLIYACSVEKCLVGKFNGTITQAAEYILNICRSNGFIIDLQSNSKMKCGGMIIELDTPDKPLKVSDPLWGKVADVAEKLMKFGDVHGDYPSTYFLKEEEENTIPPGEYKIVGTFFD